MDKQPQILKLVKLIKIHCKLNEPTCNSNVYKQDPFINFEILRLNYFKVLLQVSFFFLKRKKNLILYLNVHIIAVHMSCVE